MKNPDSSDGQAPLFLYEAQMCSEWLAQISKRLDSTATRMASNSEVPAAIQREARAAADAALSVASELSNSINVAIAWFER